MTCIIALSMTMKTINRVSWSIKLVINARDVEEEGITGNF
jgi:hypothetical protein